MSDGNGGLGCEAAYAVNFASMLVCGYRRHCDVLGGVGGALPTRKAQGTTAEQMIARTRI